MFGVNHCSRRSFHPYVSLSSYECVTILVSYQMAKKYIYMCQSHYCSERYGYRAERAHVSKNGAVIPCAAKRFKSLFLIK